MTRKRRRSAYTALSSARAVRYQPHQTSRTQTSSTLHVTPAPPEAIKDFDSSQPSPQTPTSTPLILRASDITSVQAALDFTPGTPANSFIYLGPEEQQRARALISSPDPVPFETPCAPRRLSLGSTVTPIPMRLDSESEAPANDEPRQTPLIPIQRPLPSPITPHIHHQHPALSPGEDTHPRATVNDAIGLIDPPPLQSKKAPCRRTGFLDSNALFATANGSHLASSSKVFATPHQSRVDPMPLFTTGQGKPLAPMSANSLVKAASLRHNPSPTHLVPPSNIVRSLFTTGKGKPVKIPRSIIPPASALRTPLTDKTNVSSLFTSGSGRRVPLPSNPRLPASIQHHHANKPETPTLPENMLRKILFADPTAPQSRKKHNSTSTMVLRDSVRAPVRRSYQTRSSLKTTPFRHPRRIASEDKAAKIVGSKDGNPLIPQWDVPKLSKAGSIFCLNQSHEHHSTPLGNHRYSAPDFLFAPDCLQSCLSFVFEKNAFGRYECLPKDIVQQFQLKDLASFSVGNVLSWTRTLFPAMVEKPVSCFGSAAWTRMSYSLATWKLARLDRERSVEGTAIACFLSAANLLREFLRRIVVEWHASRQPHLLRMMRKDSSPASHVVLILCGFELENEGRLIISLSDGWYVARAFGDEHIQNRIWNGKLRIGDKIGIVESFLQKQNGHRPFFFGNGDELGASVLCLSENGVRKVPGTSRLGRHAHAWCGSLRRLKDDGGKCPMVKVVILRSYPVFYMEALANVSPEDTGQRRFRSLREEGEDQAQAVFQALIREKLQADEEGHGTAGKVGDLKLELAKQRDVRTVKEVLISGVNDNPSEPSARKLLRFYNVSETVQGLINKEGDVLLLSQVAPKKSGWSCKPDGVMHVGQQNAGGTHRALETFPRKLSSVPDLRNGSVVLGNDFDGVFLVLYVTPESSNRFAYLTSAPTEAINVLALQLSEADSDCLPRALRFKKGPKARFPIIGIRDAKYCYRDSKLDILHANSTMRTSFLMSRSLSGMCHSSPMRVAHDDLESCVQGKEPQLEVLRDAVISFASGSRSSVSAYFTSTQEV